MRKLVARLVRWTHGAVSELDAKRFIQPELVHYPAPVITNTGALLD